ncbi:DNA-binding protein [uncultured Brevundimonas sp.]|uniref:DNA-binding protein n=1 Tax=uncultured Brevundimonas sp. TaxID=213418 RepID=UPI0026131FD1|nr:DNA-binding protein [uncultured Brevundimonas sp.]
MSCAFVMTDPAVKRDVAAEAEWFTLAELAALALPALPHTKRGLLKVAQREGWDTRLDDDGAALSRPRRARGGGIEYHLSVLPEAAKVKLLARSKPKAAAPVADNRESA